VTSHFALAKNGLKFRLHQDALPIITFQTVLKNCPQCKDNLPTASAPLVKEFAFSPLRDLKIYETANASLQSEVVPKRTNNRA
ncbi:MAG: hypothetical protein WCP86_11000, partial [bacterium]